MIEPIIKGTNIEVPKNVRDYAIRKLGKLDRYLNNIQKYDVEMTREKTRSPENRFVVQLTVVNKVTILRAEERGEDLLQAIDRVEEVIKRRVERFKGKLYEKGRGNSGIKDSLSEPVDEETSDKSIVKMKHFAVKPITTEEAVEQMELLGHDFYIFRDSETERINLVYRRHDGNYGLIEPEFD